MENFKYKVGDIVKDKAIDRYALITAAYSKRYEFVGEVTGYVVASLSIGFRDGDIARRYLEEHWEKVG